MLARRRVARELSVVDACDLDVACRAWQIMCPLGSYQDQSGATTCKPCVLWSLVCCDARLGIGVVRVFYCGRSVTPCNVFADGVVYTSCAIVCCRRVHVCRVHVMATERRCAGGTYPNLRDEVREGSTSCVACGPGTYLPPAPSGWETNPQTACSPCPAGKVAPSYGMSECTSKAACVCALHARASVAAVLYVC
jgi:hypothetical protein